METSRDEPEKEGFGEASLGEAQSENPPLDPEMLDGDDATGHRPENAPEDDLA
jgi:hypothetical protein